MTRHKFLPVDFDPGLDQQSEYITYKRFLETANLSTFTNSPYNFSGFKDVLDDFERSFYTLTNFPTVILLALYSPVFVIGLTGNVLILLTVFTDKHIRKAKNFYLVNLALCDLSVTLVCMPMSVGTIIYRLWVYGEFLCKFTAFLQGTVVAGSIFTLTAMSIDRYISIQHPLTANWVTSPNKALLIIAFTWLVSGIFMGPILYIRQIDTLQMPLLVDMRFCIENWPKDEDRRSFGIFLLFAVYLIPSVTLLICYAHVGETLCTNTMLREDNSDGSSGRLMSRKQAAKMLIILVILFLICWLPYNIFSLCVDLTNTNAPTSALPFALWLGHAHSAVNPVMYWVLNRRFRDRVKNLVNYIRRRSNNFQSSPTPEFV